MNLASVKTRFLFSVGANVLRALVSLLTGLLVARGLTPAGYGDLTYLLGSFVAIRALLDLGSSNAFYTFISRRARGRTFYLLYFGWLLLQFCVSLALAAAILPQAALERIWLGHSRDMIVLALIASFMQQQVWTTITQLGESLRLTVKVQSLGVAVVAAHLALMLGLQWSGLLSVRIVLMAICGEYLVALLIAPRLLRVRALLSAGVTELGVASILEEYWRFCRPLMVIAVTAFLYDFTDKWLLQRFGGASQQGFYQIAAQLATVSLLATTSILNIFWKEIAEASGRRDQARLTALYNRVNRGLFMLGAIVSCFLIPWARQIVTLLLGSAYQESWPVLGLMLLYPIHQSMGQVNATMFMACERTREYMIIALAGQLLSLPVSYFMLAPAGAALPGLALGAYGLALKMVGMNVVLANVQAWMIARFSGWKYRWAYQVAGIMVVLVLGYAAREAAVLIIPAAGDVEHKLPFIAGLALSGSIYALGLLVFLWLTPRVAGIEPEELRALLAKLGPPRLARRS